MSKTLVALWTVENKYGSVFDARSFAQRATLLEEAVTAAAAEAERDGCDGAMECIFVGPEYLFRSEKTSAFLRRYRQERQRQLDEVTRGDREVLDNEFLDEPSQSFEMQYVDSEALRLRNLLKELSQRHPRFLIVPGTVSYRKSAWSAGGLQGKTTLAHESLERMIRLRSEFDSQFRGRLPHERFEPHSPIEKGMVDHLDRKIERLKSQVGQYNSMRYNRRGMELDQLDLQYLVYNSAFVYHDGLEVLTYHKQAELGELDYEGDNTHWNMLYANGVNKVWRHWEETGINNTYAVEVCLDAGLSRIQSLPSKVDVQIIPAFGQKFQQVGRWFEKLLIFVDGHPHDNPPRVVTDGAESSYADINVGGETLSFYRIEGLGL